MKKLILAVVIGLSLTACLNDSDVKEGKKTLVIVKTLELCSSDEKEFLLKEF